MADGTTKSEFSAEAMQIRVGVLGATGIVGQRFVQLLCNWFPDGRPHPWFQLTAVGASDKSVQKLYREATSWRVSEAVPDTVANMVVKVCDPSQFKSLCDIVFSGLDSSCAGQIETAFCEAGFPVFSNASNHRHDEHVPIMLPTINPTHIEAVKRQPYYSTTGGFLVTNANCASTTLCTSLAAINRRFKVQQVVATTLQAISGAGYPGVASSDIVGNVIPYINGEEEKIQLEPLKILGHYDGNVFKFADINVSASCHRVPVADGHLIAVTVRLDEKDTSKLTSSQLVSEIEKCFVEYEAPTEVFKSLPSLPKPIIRLKEQRDRPQPKLDVNACGGFGTTVGRVRSCNIMDVKFVCLSHNTIIGGAGGSILNAEFAAASGYIKFRQSVN